MRAREDAAARARAPLRARERASERERERLAGSLEADWWPDRPVRPTVPASGRRLTESGSARRRRRDAASTRPPWPDSRLWTIDRSVHHGEKNIANGSVILLAQMFPPKFYSTMFSFSFSRNFRIYVINFGNRSSPFFLSIFP